MVRMRLVGWCCRSHVSCLDRGSTYLLRSSISAIGLGSMMSMVMGWFEWAVR